MEEDKRLWPGDIGYKGGTRTYSAEIEGKSVFVTEKRDSNGNIILFSAEPKIFGLF